MRQWVVGFVFFRAVSLPRAYGSSGSFRVAWVYSGEPRGRQVYSGSRWFTPARLAVVGLIKVRVGSLERA